MVLCVDFAFFVCMSYVGWPTGFGGCIYLFSTGNGKSGSYVGCLMG